ncbi:hypothetical protein AB3K78_15410 [Leucobacter sp. HNU]|uniref:hypothetical protein n=1 Tax=Leucobacter sp. HNU TaxID=3236805 RepID=UPI003A7FA734
MMTTNHFGPETLYDLAGDIVVPAFPGQHDQRTTGVVILTEDGSRAANMIEDPDIITAVALRMIAIADEIRENRALARASAGNVTPLPSFWGQHGPKAS